VRFAVAPGMVRCRAALATERGNGVHSSARLVMDVGLCRVRVAQAADRSMAKRVELGEIRTVRLPVGADEAHRLLARRGKPLQFRVGCVVEPESGGLSNVRRAMDWVFRCARVSARGAERARVARERERVRWLVPFARARGCGGLSSVLHVTGESSRGVVFAMALGVRVSEVGEELG
jgi:hypothetical protein